MSERSLVSEAGFDVLFDVDGDLVWASLQSRANPDFVVPRYGSGASQAEALTSANRRWAVEQVGTPPRDGPRYLP